LKIEVLVWKKEVCNATEQLKLWVNGVKNSSILKITKYGVSQTFEKKSEFKYIIKRYNGGNTLLGESSLTKFYWVTLYISCT